MGTEDSKSDKVKEREERRGQFDHPSDSLSKLLVRDHLHELANTSFSPFHPSLIKWSIGLKRGKKVRRRPKRWKDLTVKSVVHYLLLICSWIFLSTSLSLDCESPKKEKMGWMSEFWDLLFSPLPFNKKEESLSLILHLFILWFWSFILPFILVDGKMIRIRMKREWKWKLHHIHPFQEGLLFSFFLFLSMCNKRVPLFSLLNWISRWWESGTSLPSFFLKPFSLSSLPEFQWEKRLSEKGIKKEERIKESINWYRY